MVIFTKSELLKTFKIRKNIKLHEWVIMPNHVHILIQIKNQPLNTNVETHCVRLCLTQDTNNNSTQNTNNNTRDAFNASLQKINIKSNQIIPRVIKLFKASVKSICNHQNLWFAWQPRFHDQIIKDEKELLMIKNYIINNPINWQKDKFYKLPHRGSLQLKK
ncbi:MAG: transposase [Candidatus Shapirobacteria bacterium]